MKKLTQLRIDEMLHQGTPKPAAVPLPVKRLTLDDQGTYHCSNTQHSIAPTITRHFAQTNSTQADTCANNSFSRPSQREVFSPAFHSDISLKMEQKLPGYKQRIKAIFSRPSLRQRFGHLCGQQARLKRTIQTAINCLKKHSIPTTKPNIMSYILKNLDIVFTQQQFSTVEQHFTCVDNKYSIAQSQHSDTRDISKFAGRRVQTLHFVSQESRRKMNLAKTVVGMMDRQGVSSMFLQTIVALLKRQKVDPNQFRILLDDSQLFEIRKGQDASTGRLIVSLKRHKLQSVLQNMARN